MASQDEDPQFQSWADSLAKLHLKLTTSVTGKYNIVRKPVYMLAIQFKRETKMYF